MKSVARVAVAGVMLASAVHPSNAAELNTMNDVGDAIQACWTPPADAGTASVTLSFSFKRDGTLIGPPRPTAIKVMAMPRRKNRLSMLRQRLCRIACP